MRVKSILLIACLSVCLAGMGQGIKFGGKGYKEAKIMVDSNYRAINLKGSPDVIITDEVSKGEVYIVAEEKEIDRVRVMTSEGELFVSMEPRTHIGFYSSKGVRVFVSGKDVEAVKLIGSGDIYMKNAGVMRLKECVLSGSGDIKLDVDSSKLEVMLKGSGDIDLKGKAEELNAYLNGSGDLNTRGVKARKVMAKCVGSGDVDVYAEEEFRGMVSGSGDMNVYGNAKIIEWNVSGSGSISKR